MLSDHTLKYPLAKWIIGLVTGVVLFTGFLGYTFPARAQIKRLADLPTSRKIVQKSTLLPQTQPLLKTLPESLLVSLVHSYLEEQGLLNAQITFDQNSLKAALPYKESDDLKIIGFDLNPSQTRLTMILGSLLHPKTKITLQASIESLVEIPVLRHTIPIDHLVNAEDIHFVKVPSRKVSRHVVSKTEDLIGSFVRPGAARPNRPLKQIDLQKPQLIKRGQNVALRVNHHKIKMEMLVKALENGEKGQRIRLLNTETNRTLQATVTDQGQAEINLTKPLILAEGGLS
tara:strand:- start:831 stop:1691 length:861 start_codon:yes stop_codon:yes gene_type:complete